MPLNVIFLYGALGAFMVEFQAFYQEFNQPTLEPVGIPRRYLRGSYWFLQLVHATLGGVLTLAWANAHPAMDLLVAMAVGGSSRMVIMTFGDIVGKMRRG